MNEKIEKKSLGEKRKSGLSNGIAARTMPFLRNRLFFFNLVLTESPVKARAGALSRSEEAMREKLCVDCRNFEGNFGIDTGFCHAAKDFLGSIMPVLGCLVAWNGQAGRCRHFEDKEGGALWT